MMGFRRWAVLGVAVLLAACGGDRPERGREASDLPAVEGPAAGWHTRADGFDYGGDELQVLREPDAFGFRTQYGGIAFREEDVRGQLPIRVQGTFVQRRAGPDDQAAYGIFVGGRMLLVGDQEYVALVIRPTGEYRIERRLRGEVTPVVDWTRTGAIRTPGDASEVVTNLLRIDAEGEEVVFHINTDVVARLARTLVDPLGAVGIRVDPGLNLSVPIWEVL